MTAVEGGFYYRIKVVTEFTDKNNFEMEDFINNIKNSFKNAVIITIESLPMKYDKFDRYTYKVKFYHDLDLKQ
jgi:hypothetical protein